jgi:Fe-S cluster biogenesis protein NfuA
MNDEPLRVKTEHALQGDIARELNLDGSAIEVLDVDRGVARVRIGAACASCPASLMTLIQALEAELKSRVPEIDYLEAAL